MLPNERKNITLPQEGVRVLNTGGCKPPCFLCMEQCVSDLVGRFCQKRQDIFLIDFNVSSSGDIRLVIDGDKGVSVQDCVDLSKHIEQGLDDRGYDFSIEVTSSGLLEPIKVRRQYFKNVNRTLEVKTLSGDKIVGKLIKVSDSGITLEFKKRVPKDIGKGKRTVVERSQIDYDRVVKASIKATF